MRDLFDRLQAEGEAVLREMLEQQTPETVELEFKAKADLQRPGLTTDDRRNLGRTLSAFANSAGGLLIFGADARTKVEGVDCLSELTPIPNIARFATEARVLSGQYLMPRHPGIAQATIPTDEGDDAGYLAIYVERSERRPHMSMAPEDRRYHKRAGDSTFVMEHYDVEDAFNRISAPSISFEARIDEVRHGMGDSFNIFVSLALRNTGESLVRHPYIAITGSNGTVYGQGGYEASKYPRWKHTNDAPGQQLTGGVDDVIHAGTAQVAGFLFYSFVFDQQRQHHRIGPEHIDNFSVRGTVQFGAEGGRLTQQEFEIPNADVAARLRAVGAL